MAPRTNEYGMTYAEWFAAATLGGKHEPSYLGTIIPDARMRRAWLAGEDPTEWAHCFEIEATKGQSK